MDVNGFGNKKKNLDEQSQQKQQPHNGYLLVTCNSTKFHFAKQNIVLTTSEFFHLIYSDDHTWWPLDAFRVVCLRKELAPLKLKEPKGVLMS